MVAQLLLAFLPSVIGHGTLVEPVSNRVQGSYFTAGDCVNYGCLWFSQIVTIPGEPTLPKEFRTYNVDVDGGPKDWNRKMPWRSPGSAPVLGSGCGIAAGLNVSLQNGGFPPKGVAPGADAMDILPPQAPVVWQRGQVVDVGWALTANHGGGYSYRLCKVEPGKKVNEQCFQKNPLNFVGTHHTFKWGRFNPTQPDIQVPRKVVSVGTTPLGSQWARNPVPACKYCDQREHCGDPVFPNFTAVSGPIPWGGVFYGGDAWVSQVDCESTCNGATPDDTAHPAPPVGINETDYGLSDGQLCAPGMVQFPEPIPGISGFLGNHSYPERSILAFSIVDQVQIPWDLEEGTYLLGWRWDCEQAEQIWQACADIVVKGTLPQPLPSSPDWKLYFIIAICILGAFTLFGILFAVHQCKQRHKGFEGMKDPLRRSSVQ